MIKRFIPQVRTISQTSQWLYQRHVWNKSSSEIFAASFVSKLTRQHFSVEITAQAQFCWVRYGAMETDDVVSTNLGVNTDLLTVFMVWICFPFIWNVSHTSSRPYLLFYFCRVNTSATAYMYVPIFINLHYFNWTW